MQRLGLLPGLTLLEGQVLDRNMTIGQTAFRFAAFMVSTSIPNVMQDPEASKFITDLGYPLYFVPFIGAAKILGATAILIPGFPRIKEWAYAGFFFDLAGAWYSIIKTQPFQLQMLFMVLPISLLFASYFLWHKKSRSVFLLLFS